MKIVQINSSCGTGSIGRSVAELAETMEQMGHDSYVFCADKTSSYHNTERIGNSFDHKIHAMLSRITGKQGYFSVIATYKLVKRLKEIDPNVVHLDNLHSNYINLRILLGYLAKEDIPTVITLHDCWFYTGKCTYYIEADCKKWQSTCGDCPLLHKDNVNPTWFFDRTKKCLRDKKRLFSSIPRLGVVGVSEWVTREARKSFLGRGNPITIYNWIDTGVFYPRNTEEKVRRCINAEGKFVILMVTTFISRKKGYDVLKMLADNVDENTKVIIIGKNPQNLDIPDNVLHIPHTNDANELAEYYSMADVCVNTTWYETFGKVTAEAMCCGIPVIVYNNTASPELVPEGCGYVINQEDGNEAILDAIEKVRQNGKETYSRACVEHSHNVFSKEVGIAKHMKLYESLQKK